MDPNATLTELRELTAMATPWSEYESDRIQELVGALDEWLSKGGFLPDAWAKGR